MNSDKHPVFWYNLNMLEGKYGKGDKDIAGVLNKSLATYSKKKNGKVAWFLDECASVADYFTSLAKKNGEKVIVSDNVKQDRRYSVDEIFLRKG